MNFDQFKYLAEIDKNKSISKASEKLYMTTQALSISIKKLEDELTVPLLSRSPKGAVLTPEGEKVLEAYDLFRANLIDIASEYAYIAKIKSDFYLPVNYRALENLNKIFLQELFSFFPNISFVIEENTSENILSFLIERKIELGIIYQFYKDNIYFSAYSDDIECIPLITGALQIESTNTKVLEKISSLADAVKYPIISQNGTDLSTNNFKKILSQDFPFLDIQLTNSAAYYSAIISQGERLGLAISFTTPLRSNINCSIKQISSDYSIQICLAYNKKHTLSPIAQNIKNRIIEMVR